MHMIGAMGDGYAERGELLLRSASSMRCRGCWLMNAATLLSALVLSVALGLSGVAAFAGLWWRERLRRLRADAANVALKAAALEAEEQRCLAQTMLAQAMEHNARRRAEGSDQF